ncbi:MAG: hypothetical protein KDD90_05665 [Sphingomonadaceae bacterium]|jgi:hypothetical protein|nr:hypothetical protein [Sphingomonadaceae bacterium]
MASRRVLAVAAVLAVLMGALAAWDLRRENIRKGPMADFVERLEVRPGSDGMRAMLADIRHREEGSQLRSWARAARDRYRLWRDIPERAVRRSTCALPHACSMKAIPKGR